MKKLFRFLSIFLLSLSIGACSNNKDKTVDVYMPDGAPALAMAKLMYEKYTTKGYTVKYHIVASETITSHITNGDADIAIVPTNAAANLYNKGNKIKIVSSNTWGLLYMVGNANNTTPITDLNSLKGEVVGIIGQGQVPDLVFKYILKANNIEYVASDTAIDNKVALKYFADGPSMIPLLKQKQLKYGILGEPAVSTSVANASTSIVLDIQSAWQEASGQSSSYPQASLVVKSSFLENHSDFINSMLEELETSNTWILDNIDKLNDTLKDHGSTTNISYTVEILQRCNIRLVKGIEMKTAVNAFLDSIYSIVPNSIGGQLPNDSFYYIP
ncbi:MAG: ABC transporter substrate-binding protein [Erysipelotrichaceae bacterium]|nr:ABC transporter substrate-binding protein [Erysipelotrichaceae bacterium]